MGTYQRLTQEERYQIKALLAAECNRTEIAQILGRDKSTISREISRNTGKKGYRPKQAHKKAMERQKSKPKHRISDKTGWLSTTHDISVSHEWIYQYVLLDKKQGGALYTNLRCQKKRKKRYGSTRADKRGQIKDRVSIDERPAEVDERVRIGDWEADTVIGKHRGSRPVLVTLTERKSRLSLIIKAKNKTAAEVSSKLIEIMKPVKEKVITLTYDNGKEFAMHKAISKALDMEGYFAHPYHSWERGLNENTNGLIRQYFPKQTDFSEVTDEEVEFVMSALNNRPRKCLGWKTPNQVFFGINPPVALTS